MKQEAAERARQEIRIQDRKIHRELQQELSENPDMLDKAEIFVTEAYKRQQEEIKRLDEEERQALEKDGQGDVTKKKSFAGFFKNILDDRERTAAAVQNELKSGRAKGQLMDTETTGTSSSTAGKPLGAGLNVLKRPADYVLGKRTSSGADSSGVGKGSQHRLDRKERERMAHEFEKQLLEKQMEDERKRQEEEEELRQKWARQTNEDSAAEARRRFEERRKARLAEAKDVNTET
jgi:coiled-coil domain-containing protein 55